MREREREPSPSLVLQSTRAEVIASSQAVSSHGGRQAIEALYGSSSTALKSFFARFSASEIRSFGKLSYLNNGYGRELQIGLTGGTTRNPRVRFTVRSLPNKATNRRLAQWPSTAQPEACQSQASNRCTNSAWT